MDVSNVANTLHNSKLSCKKKSLSITSVNEDQSASCSNFSSTKPLKCKSLSLTNLSNKSSKYDHVQSKVKLYIQEMKRRDARGKHNGKNTEALKLDQDESAVYNASQRYSDEEPINLSSNKGKKINKEIETFKRKISNANDIEKDNLVESIFHDLEEEQKVRNEHEMTINNLQLEYEDTLLKLAEAQTKIDNMRFYKFYYDANEKIYNSGSSDASTKVKKAFSTSNIFSKHRYSTESLASNSNYDLVRYSSTPQVDQSFYSMNYCSANSSESNAASNTVGKNNNVDWDQKVKYINEKIKECLILEANSALNKDEEEIVWNFILNKFAELAADVSWNKTLSTDLTHDRQSVLDDLGRVIEGLLEKYHPDNHSLFEKLNHAKINRSSPNFVRPQISSKENSPPISLRSIANENVQHCKRKTDFAINKSLPLRDVDSGCPPSERSNEIRRSPDQFDQMNCDKDSSKSSRASSISSSHKDSLVPHNWKYFAGHSKEGELYYKGHNQANYYTKRNSVFKNYFDVVDEEYDASCSDQDSSFDNPFNAKKSKKKFGKSPMIRGSSPLNRFDDKFVIVNSNRDQFDSSNEHNVHRTQMKRNMKQLEAQVNKMNDGKILLNLKQPKKNAKFCESKSSNTPLKALSRDSLTNVQVLSSERSITSSISSECDKSKSMNDEIPSFFKASSSTQEGYSDRNSLSNSSVYIHKSPEQRTPFKSREFQRFRSSTPVKHSCNLTSLKHSPQNVSHCGPDNTAIAANLSSESSFSLASRSKNQTSKAEVRHDSSIHSGCNRKSRSKELINESVDINTSKPRSSNDSLRPTEGGGKMERHSNQPFIERCSTLLTSLNETTRLAECIQNRSQELLQMLLDSSKSSGDLH